MLMKITSRLPVIGAVLALLLFENRITLRTHPIGQQFVPLLGKIDWLAANPPVGIPEIGQANFGGGHPFSDAAADFFGSLLVRPHSWPSRDLFLQVGDETITPPVLTADELFPTSATPRYSDSGSVSFGGGNVWQEIGTWAALPELMVAGLAAMGDLHVWLGLKNSDDQGTRFDVRAEVYRDGELVTTGLRRCIAGIVRNPSNAVEVAVPFDPFEPVAFDGPTQELKVRVLARIGTTPNNTKCPGHNSASGLRLYFDAGNRASQFRAVAP
jgi:hypothetical protein